MGLIVSSEKIHKTQLDRITVTSELKRDQISTGEVNVEKINSQELIQILQDSQEQIKINIIGYSTLAYIIFAAFLFIGIRKLIYPFKTSIANLQEVSKGNWKIEISNTDRPDDIGVMSRSLIILQKAMEERDRLKLYMSNAEGVNKRRHNLEESIRKFEKLMRTELLDVNDGVDKMEDMARDLARFSAIAEGEAAEVAFITDHTAGTIRRMGEQTEAVDTDENHSGNDFDAGVRALKALSASNHLYPQASLQINNLAETLAADLEKALHVIEQTRKADIFSTRAETEAFKTVEDAMKTALRSVTLLKQQELTTHQILAHLSKAQTGAITVSASVKRLRSTIEETRSASVKVVATAENMAEKAVNLNLAVKSFLHNVLVH
jgi:methyl-accepting chemotaxis protein